MTDHHAADPFHIAVPVHDLAAARTFYGEVLGCPQGRSAETWIDFDMFGHQVVVHLAPGMTAAHHTTPVDGDDVPVPHFGVVLTMARWQALAAKLEVQNVNFIIRPHVRFPGEAGEQATMFFLDPSGNAIEFKAFTDRRRLFATTR